MHQFHIQLQELLVPSGSFNVVGSQFCPGDELTLSLDIDGESTYSYDWVNLNSSESFIENTASISPQENFVYDVAVIDECNNNETLFSYTVETPVYPPPSFDLSDFTGCVGQEIEISVGDAAEDDERFIDIRTDQEKAAEEEEKGPARRAQVVEQGARSGDRGALPGKSDRDPENLVKRAAEETVAPE